MLNQNQAPSMPDMYTPSPFFLDHLHKHGRSGLFLTGIILFSIGSIMASIFALNIFAIPALLLTSLPVIGLWLIYTAAKNPQIPEKTLPALTLFKVHAIASMVFIIVSMVGVFALLFFLFNFMALAFGAEDIMIIFNIILIVSAVIAAVIIGLFIAFYYVPILKIIKSIRHNIENNTFSPIRGVLALTIMASISVLAAALSSLMGLATLPFMGAAYTDMADLQQLMGGYSSEIDWLFPLLTTATSSGLLAFSYFFTLVNMAGTVILIIVLNKFAYGMPRSLYSN